MQPDLWSLEHIISLTLLPTWELLIRLSAQIEVQVMHIIITTANAITACELITLIRKCLFVLKGKVK